MNTKECNIKKYCCFYVSEYHLEMILLPFIKEKINNSKIVIFTQYNLLETIKVLLDRINFRENEKNKILNLHYWNNKEIENLINLDKEYIFIINGNINYIEKINKKVKCYGLNKISIIDCYNIEKVDIKTIESRYNYKLNTYRI